MRPPGDGYGSGRAQTDPSYSARGNKVSHLFCPRLYLYDMQTRLALVQRAVLQHRAVSPSTAVSPSSTDYTDYSNNVLTPHSSHSVHAVPQRHRPRAPGEQVHPV